MDEYFAVLKRLRSNVHLSGAVKTAIAEVRSLILVLEQTDRLY